MYVTKKVGYKLLAKFTEKGLSNLGKAIPLAGGLIGGTIDATSTRIVGKVAKKTFYTRPGRLQVELNSKHSFILSIPAISCSISSIVL